MPYNIQNNEYSTELEHENQGTLTTIDMFSDLKKLLIFCRPPLTLISLIINLRRCFKYL